MSKDNKEKKVRIPENAPITETEQSIMDEMKTKLGERITTNNLSENTLLRFVRGYKDDEKPREKAIEMLTNMITWRETEKVNEWGNPDVLLPNTDKFRKLWPSGFHGYDRLGHPIYVERLGSVDSSKLTKEFTMADAIKFHVQLMETVTKMKDDMSKQRGDRVYKQLVILDLKGLGMSHLSSKFRAPMSQFIHIDQDFYPETLFVMVIINAGFLVKAAWAIVSPLLDPITKQNIRFGAGNLLEFVDAEQIPRIFGGTCGCEGGKCLEVPFKLGDKSEKCNIKPEKEKVELE
jgi:hypothetical protein